jgi:hypothetical protein
MLLLELELELLLELLEDDDELDELLKLELLLPSQHRQPMVRYALVSSWKWQTICWLVRSA